MYFSLVSLLSLHLALSAAWSIPGVKSKRGAETDATLFAYGTNTSGWPVAYGLDDGTNMLRKVLSSILGFGQIMLNDSSNLPRQTLYYCHS